MKRLFILSILFLFISGCSQSETSFLEGSWEVNDSCPTRFGKEGDRITFEKDGKLSHNEHFRNWELEDDGTTLILSHPQFEVREFVFKKIDDDTISITEDGVAWQDSCELKRK